MNNNKDNFELIKSKPKTEYEKYLERENQLAQEWEERKERLFTGKDSFYTLTEEELSTLMGEIPVSREYKIKGCDFEKLQRFNKLITLGKQLSELNPEIFIVEHVGMPNKGRLNGSITVSINKQYEIKGQEFELFKNMIQCCDMYLQDLRENSKGKFKVISVFYVKNIYTGDVIKETYL